MKTKVFLIFVIFVIISPWFWVLIRNFNYITPPLEKTIFSKSYLNDTNILQGQAKDAQLGFLGKILVNKATVPFNDFLNRYFESYDSRFLFYEGDVEITKSTREAGVIYLGFLPLIIIGIYQLVKKIREKTSKFLLFCLIITPISGAILVDHYDMFFRIPFILVLTFLASTGFFKILSQNKRLAYLFIIFILIQITFFVHDFTYHYSSRFQEVIKNTNHES